MKDTPETIHQDGLMNFDNFSEQSRIRKWLRRIFFIDPIVRQFKGYVLDIGCGPGLYLEHYSGLSLGIDAHPNNIRICLEKGIQAIQENANNFVRENTFDTVIISHVLEHLENPSVVIENAFRSTKKNGRIIIIVPCREGFISGLNKEVGHKHFIDEEYIDNVMKKLGGTKLHSSFFPRFLGGKLKELRTIYRKQNDSNY